MDSNQISDQLDQQFLIIIVPAILAAAALLLWANRERIRTRYAEWRTERCLNSIGVDQIRHFVCPDGLDGQFKIGRLALTPNAIVLISHKRYAGRIYCAERIAEWTQVIEQKSFKFENPLFELENQITAIKLLTGTQAINGYLFFNQGASFPKGHPESVLLQDNIPENLLSNHIATTPIQPAVQKIWDYLKTIKNNRLEESSTGAKT
ncbi:MAG: nuclease-related domain-containing protein [Pseudomonadota bacterium]